jgi:hypothetical protein
MKTLLLFSLMSLPMYAASVCPFPNNMPSQPADYLLISNGTTFSLYVNLHNGKKPLEEIGNTTIAGILAQLKKDGYKL